MKKIRICSIQCVLIIVFLVGCGGIPERNYIGMTKAEVAAHLEKYAFRDRWSGNRFDIAVTRSKIFSHAFRNAQEVAKNQSVMSADQWNCDFFPQRHWLLGWNGLFSRWHSYTLDFKNGRVARQQKNTGLPYWVRGNAGQSPYPNYPKNFHKVNENLYRSGQPDEDEFESLYSFNNIRSVLNLRENNSDKDEIDAVNRNWNNAVTLYGIPLDTGNISEGELYKILTVIRSDKDEIDAVNRNWNNAVTLYEIPLDTGEITEANLYKILTVIRDAPKPLLIHCWHGSDRTGCAVAAYRIVFENWSVEDAISELMKPEYGHHKNIYTNIPELLRKADWKKIRETILNKGK